MFAFELLCSVDPSLGRVNYSLLSDQTLMEMLIEDLDDEAKKRYQDNEGMYLDVCKWSFVTCDDDERVIEMGADSSVISGSIHLSFVPPKVKVLKIKPPWTGGKLTGSVDLAHLPRGVRAIDLRNNELTGEVDLTHLPESIEKLYLGRNQLTGGIDLTQLPGRMDYLSLNNNQLTGGVDLTQLPDEMEELYLNNNRFTGEIDLAHLPVGMQFLFLENNQLSGPFVIKRLTHGISINARGNNFNTVAVVNAKTPSHIFLGGSGVTSVVDENGKERDSKRFLE